MKDKAGKKYRFQENLLDPSVGLGGERGLSLLPCKVKKAAIYQDRVVAQAYTTDGYLIGGTTVTEDGTIGEGVWLFFVETIDDILLRYGTIRPGDNCILFYPSGQLEKGVLMRSQDFTSVIEPDTMELKAKGPLRVMGA